MVVLEDTSLLFNMNLHNIYFHESERVVLVYVIRWKSMHMKWLTLMKIHKLFFNIKNMDFFLSLTTLSGKEVDAPNTSNYVKLNIN